MNVRKMLFPVLVASMLVTTAALAQSGGGYDLTWWTVDGGGGTVSGGGYLLEGTAGQPDAGATLSGGGYTLTGGFWTGGGGTSPTCPDAYEPNEDFAGAKSITPGAAIQAYICDANDQDWFRFNVSAGQNISVDLTNLPTDYDLELFDPSRGSVGSSASGGTAHEHIAHTAAASGAYRVKVFGYGGHFDASNSYTLRVQLSGGPAQSKVYMPIMLK